jgi:hypothetical protein
MLMSTSTLKMPTPVIGAVLGTAARRPPSVDMGCTLAAVSTPRREYLRSIHLPSILHLPPAVAWNGSPVARGGTIGR